MLLVDLVGTGLFRSAGVLFFAHATEDAVRIAGRVTELLSIPLSEFKTVSLTGHFGNPIESSQATLYGEMADNLARAVLSKLSLFDIGLLSSSLNKFVDEHGNLYLRIDKQALFREIITLGSSDAVRITLRPSTKGRPMLDESISMYRMLVSEWGKKEPLS